MTSRREHFYVIRPEVAYQDTDGRQLRYPADARPFDALSPARGAALAKASAEGKPQFVYEVRLIGSYGPPLPVWRKAARTKTRTKRNKRR